jgi:hypothetical protein
MFCTRCGASVSDGASFCTSCGQPTAAASVPVTAVIATPAVAVAGAAFPAVPPQPVYVPAAAAVPYAGFWLRFVAYFIDSALIMFIFGILAGIAILGLGGMAFLQNIPEELNAGNPAFVASLITFYGLFLLVALLGGWLYFAIMESSQRQATLGKMALGLTVTDDKAQRMSFGRATGRYF